MTRFISGRRISNDVQGSTRKLFLLAVCILPFAGCGLYSAPSVASDGQSRFPGRALAPYYSGVDSSTVSSLRNSLHRIISQHRVLHYKTVWRALETIEQSEQGVANIRLFYSRRVIPADRKASGQYQSENDYWNREHIWPQSKGIKRTSAKSDLHNIVAADRSINSSRGNKYFDVGGDTHNECLSCRSDRNSWEPPDEIKGDVARVLFYMELRYEGGDQSGVGDLQLVNREHLRHDNQLGSLSVLLQWHCSDPVSGYEKRRNDIINKLQGNRNPFVDYPLWTASIFGHEC